MRTGDRKTQISLSNYRPRGFTQRNKKINMLTKRQELFLQLYKPIYEKNSNTTENTDPKRK
jgi:hypothetical protein